MQTTSDCCFVSRFAGESTAVDVGDEEEEDDEEEEEREETAGGTGEGKEDGIDVRGNNIASSASSASSSSCTASSSSSSSFEQSFAVGGALVRSVAQ